MKNILFVMISLFIVLPAYPKNPDIQPVGRDAHTLFTEILSEYVHNGSVNYADMKKDDRLQKYTDWLSKTNPGEIEGQDDRLAFWINAYNAFTLKIVCDNYPVESIKDISFGGTLISNVLNASVWDKKFFKISGTEMSLNHIEHEIIRKEFDDPRIHFALVCAAVSCPPLRSEAYEGYKLDKQLNDQGKIFFSQKDKNYFDVEEKVAHLSKILDWYGKDFGDTDKEILKYITRFLPDDISTGIKQNADEWEIKYTDYDWSLNE